MEMGIKYARRQSSDVDGPVGEFVVHVRDERVVRLVDGEAEDDLLQGDTYVMPFAVADG